MADEKIGFFLGLQYGVSYETAAKDSAIIRPEELFIDSNNYFWFKKSDGTVIQPFCAVPSSEQDIDVSVKTSGAVVIMGTETVDGVTTYKLLTKNLAYALPEASRALMTDGQIGIVVVRATLVGTEMEYTADVIPPAEIFGYTPADKDGEEFTDDIILANESKLIIE